MSSKGNIVCGQIMTKYATKLLQYYSMFNLRKNNSFFVTKDDQQRNFLIDFIHIGKLLLDCALNKKIK